MQRADSLEKTDAGKDWGQKEKGETKDEMAGWHCSLNVHEFEQTLGDRGQRSLVCYSPWSCKELDTTERLNLNNDRRGSKPWFQYLVLRFFSSGYSRQDLRIRLNFLFHIGKWKESLTVKPCSSEIYSNLQNMFLFCNRWRSSKHICKFTPGKIPFHLSKPNLEVMLSLKPSWVL